MSRRSFGAGASLSAVHLALRDADFALITFEEEEEAARAQRVAHGQTWRGKKIQVRTKRLLPAGAGLAAHE